MKKSRRYLSSSEVGEIRALHASGLSGKELAARYGISCSNVSRLVRMKTWRPDTKSRFLEVCKRGHPFTEENTVMHNGFRNCRECARMRLYKYKGRVPPERALNGRHPRYGHKLFEKLPTHTIARIEKLAVEGYSLSAIAKDTGCHLLTAQRYVSRIVGRPNCGCGRKGGHGGSCVWRSGGMAIYPFVFDTNVEGFELLDAINRVVPRGLYEDIRQDVCQSLALKVIEEGIPLSDLGKYVRQEISRAYPPWIEVSYDTPLDGGDRYANIIGVY